jgi:hypothetical protein
VKHDLEGRVEVYSENVGPPQAVTDTLVKTSCAITDSDIGDINDWKEKAPPVVFIFSQQIDAFSQAIVNPNKSDA